MPTARELLEQADALMRRNRMGVGGDTPSRPARTGKDPPTVSPTSGPPTSARTIQREPIAPSVARTPLPVHPTVSPAFEVPARSDERPVSEPPSPTTDDAPPVVEAEFPLLTEAVDEPEAAAGTPLDDLSDVPVLTDAVEEIDVGIVDEAARGEPSIWALTARGETSVLGPAPDSIVLVPPPEVPRAPPEGRDPLGLDQPPLGYERPEEADSAVQARIDAADAIQPPEVDASTPDDTDAVEQSQPVSQGLESSEPHPRPPTAGSWTPDAASDDADEPAPRVSFSIADRTPEDAQEAEMAAEPSPEAPSPEAPPAVQATIPMPPQLSDLDQQRIREIAEEIGMQVLQRIDIFTDTTLRAQLGERLRPVIDRAAADLVASINEHVGELLRAYVSEAIEREIESWRRKDR